MPQVANGCLERGVQRLVAVAMVLGLAACGGSPTAPGTTPAPTTAAVLIPGFSAQSFREAGRITSVAAGEIRSAVRAGMLERDLKALVDAVFSREHGGPPAFDHIVAAGANALSLHYAGDAGELRDGDLLLIDIGATSDGHCSDLSRTFSVSPRFTPRQLELYQLVVDAGSMAGAGAQIGVESLAEMDARIRAFFRASPLRAKDANGLEQTMDRFFIHSAVHFVGRQVHGGDTGWSSAEPLVAGRVFAIEPGLYIPSEGIGIRVEDTYLSTPTGLECLTCAAWR